VVGTNGKGSVAWKAAAGLQALGYCVGLYTSPHLLTIRERIRVNQQVISERDFADTCDQVLRASAEPTSTFEAVTLMAFAHFAQRRVDVAVVEAGMGGSGDATNFVSRPSAVVITNVAVDHAHILGPDLLDIARNKAGAIKPAVPLVLGPSGHPAVQDLLVREARRMSAPWLQVPEFAGLDEQNEELALACVALAMRRSPPPREAVGVRAPCRCQVFPAGGGKRVVLDVGHNPAALQRLARELLERRRDLRPSRGALLLGLAKNKDARGCVAAIAGLGWARVALVGLHGAAREGADVRLLQSLCAEHHPAPEAWPELDAGDALAVLLRDPGVDFVLVCGSHSLMKSPLQRLEPGAPPADPVDMNEG
jgi:dihydrofolate synthase/folylpolyglutamate synthase